MVHFVCELKYFLIACLLKLSYFGKNSRTFAKFFGTKFVLGNNFAFVFGQVHL